MRPCLCPLSVARLRPFTRISLLGGVSERPRPHVLSYVPVVLASVCTRSHSDSSPCLARVFGECRVLDGLVQRGASVLVLCVPRQQCQLCRLCDVRLQQRLLGQRQRLVAGVRQYVLPLCLDARAPARPPDGPRARC